MVSSIGYKLNNPTLISGFGYRHRVIHQHAGRGVGWRAVGSVISTVGHAFVNKSAFAISGSGYKRKRFFKPLSLNVIIFWILTS